MPDALHATLFSPPFSSVVLQLDAWNLNSFPFAGCSVYGRHGLMFTDYVRMPSSASFFDEGTPFAVHPRSL